MPGFFKDTSGLDDSDNGLSTNNAAQDFVRSGAAPSDLFERLFGRKGSGRITSEPLPPPPGSTPQPAISSAPSLVGRVLQASAPPAPQPTPQQQPYNPTGMQGPPAGPRPPQRPPFDPSMLRPPMQAQPQPLPPFQGIPQFNPTLDGPPPAQPRFGGNQFGGNRFGGNQFGGNRFGGNQFGASAPQAAPQDPSSMDPDMIASIVSLLQGGGGNARREYGGNEFGGARYGGNQYGGAQFGATAPRGFFRGGVMSFARGGYPQLMGGLPERQPFAGAGYVEPDGQGDGRSDHIKAVLSPGEFVTDAESVSLLGNGDNDAGARGMEAIRQEIRKHKGKALAKGKFSPNAQSPAKLAKIGARAATKRAS